jgi:hypothetical protein
MSDPRTKQYLDDFAAFPVADQLRALAAEAVDMRARTLDIPSFGDKPDRHAQAAAILLARGKA